MDKMQPNAKLPNEQLLQQWAQEKNAEQLSTALDALSQPEVRNDITEKLESMSLKFALASVFSGATDEVDKLYTARLEATKEPVATALENKAKTGQQVQEVETGIDNFLRGFRSNVDKACSLAETASRFDAIKTALTEEATRSKVFERLATLAEVPAGQSTWIREQAQDTALGVTETLWEIVGIGRDFIGLSAGNEAQETLEACLSDWQETVKANFPYAKQILSEAVHWLTK